MHLISAVTSTWENLIKQNNDVNTYTITEHDFIESLRVLTVQKVTSRELYRILITTTKHNLTSPKIFLKKIH